MDHTPFISIIGVLFELIIRVLFHIFNCLTSQKKQIIHVHFAPFIPSALFYISLDSFIYSDYRSQSHYSFFFLIFSYDLFILFSRNPSDNESFRKRFRFKSRHFFSVFPCHYPNLKGFLRDLQSDPAFFRIVSLFSLFQFPLNN